MASNILKAIDMRMRLLGHSIVDLTAITEGGSGNQGGNGAQFRAVAPQG